MKVFKFGNCYLNLTERRVVKNGKYLELTPKTFDVLRLLVEKSGEVVSKDEILGNVWQGSFVEEGNLAVHVSKLRRLLDETKNEHFIETIQGSGYRFVSAAEPVGVEEWRKNLPDQNHRQSGRFEKHADEFSFDSIAVLPLANESDNVEIDYLADGLTESFINSLSHISGLKVIARNTVFRYKNKETDAREVGVTLGVATILTGRIRLIKKCLMFSVELTKTADGTQLWGKQFNHPFSEIIEVQEEIISAVSQQLQTEIKSVTQNNESTAITNNAESYKFYLMGRYLYDKQMVADINKAVDCFQTSAFHDTKNVHAYVGIIDCFLLLYFYDNATFDETLAKTTPFLQTVLQLRQDIDVVQVMWGKINLHFERNIKKAEVSFKYALSLTPNSTIAFYFYIDVLLYLGKHSEILKCLPKFIQMDSLSALTYKRAGKIYYRLGKFEVAINYLEDAFELESSDYQTPYLLGACLVELGKYNEALSYFYKSLSINDNFETLSMIGYTKAVEGKSDEAYQVIDNMKSRILSENSALTHLARIYAALGENDIAIQLLTFSFKHREIDHMTLTSDPRWKKIRNEPKFKDLCSRVGLPT